MNLPAKASGSVDSAKRSSGSIVGLAPTSQPCSDEKNSQAVSIRSAASGKSNATSHSGSVTLPTLTWQIKAGDIVMVKDASGAPLKLGSGAYGSVFKATIDGVTEVFCESIPRHPYSRRTS